MSKDGNTTRTLLDAYEKQRGRMEDSRKLESQRWYEFTCPDCRKHNFVSDGDPNDPTLFDIESWKCWNCCGVFDCSGELIEQGHDLWELADEGRQFVGEIPVGDGTSR